jgi:hypothetical protein
VYRTALDSAHSFAKEHPGLAQVYGLAEAAEKVGDLATDRASELYGESLAQMALMADKSEKGYRTNYLRVARKLSVAQFHKRDLVDALTTLTPALNLAESAVSSNSTEGTQREVAVINFYMGEILARSGQDAVAVPKLRKALELYQELTRSKVTVNQSSPEAYERGLAEVAALAPPELREEIETGLAQFR